jgi:hypothetical protein
VSHYASSKENPMPEFIPEYNWLYLSIGSGIFAILGTVVGLIVGHILRASGKLAVYLSSSECYLTTSDKQGGREKTISLDESDGVTMSFGIDFYNASDTPKSLRDLKIESVPKSKKIPVTSQIYVHKDDAQYWPYQQFNTINIPPKEFVYSFITSWIQEKDMHLVENEVTIYLKGLFPTGKEFKAKLLSTTLT